MKNNSKLEINDLYNKIANSDLEDLSNSKTAEIVGGSLYSNLMAAHRRVGGGISTRRSPKDPTNFTSFNP